MTGGVPTPPAGRTPRLVVVAGPTGTGKSDLAVALARRLDGEVINADSMQLYRGMDIGTAKLTAAERHGIPHHLLDVLDVTQTASVAAYQRAARAAIESVRAAGRTPILAGGSGLYIQAVVDDIDFPPADRHVRERLQTELTEHGLAPLRRRLERIDPAAAAVIDAHDGRRTLRALEVNELTGRPFQARLPRSDRPRYDAALLCLDRDTGELDQRLAHRVDVMIKRGFLAEVRALDAAGLREGATASRALGYRQLLCVLDGQWDIDQAMRQTVTATRRFVRRQRSWFRRDTRLIWLDAAREDLVIRALRAIDDAAVGLRA